MFSDGHTQGMLYVSKWGGRRPPPEKLTQYSRIPHAARSRLFLAFIFYLVSLIYTHLNIMKKRLLNIVMFIIYVSYRPKLNML